jgi:GT2 family glycosyltransferase
MKVGFVFTNYNNSSYTRAAVQSLHAGSRWSDTRIVVVDNQSQASDIESLKQIARDYPDIQLVLNPENVGYFRGLNVGIRHLRASCPEIDCVVVGNNDLTFPNDFVQRLQENRPLFERWPVVAPDLVTPTGVHQNPHVLHPISGLRKFVWNLYFLSYSLSIIIRYAAWVTRRYTGRKENSSASELYKVSGPIEQGYGACYILGPQFFRHFTTLCAPSFLMQEEYFLSEQLKTIGQTVFYDPRFVVQHHHHASMGKLPSRRHWMISRDAHRVYRRFVKMKPEERTRFIADLSGGARGPDAIPGSPVGATH